MSDYSYSQDAKDYLSDYKKKIKSDPRLEFHQDLVQDFGESYERAYQLWNTYYAEAYKDLSYYLGNQWSLEELSYLNNQRRSSFTYNKIFRLINLVLGRYSDTMRGYNVAPIENSSDLTAEIQTDALQYVMQYGSGHDIVKKAVKGSLTTGMAFVSPWMDYRDDPVSGDIKFHLDEWNAVILDPFLTKKDLSDCSFIARRKFLSRTEVISLLPEKQAEIEALPWGSRDDKFTYMPYARQWGMQKLLNYNEYWRTKWETKSVLVDMETGETRQWDGDRKRLFILRKMFPQLEVIKKPVRSVELGIIVEGQLLYYGKDPGGLNDYPFVPYFAVFEPSYDLYTWKIQSLVRFLRDPQTEINKRRSKKVDIIDNQLNSGWIAKTNSVTNPSSMYKSGQGQVIWLKPEAQMTDVQRIPSANIDGSQFQLEAEFEKDMFEILGLSQENVGMSENEKIETAGILAKSRQMAGWIPMQHIFDGIWESQKLLGEKCLKLIQNNYTPEKIKLITKKDPTPEFYSKSFGRYNVVVEEGILTDTQRQSQFVQLVALKQMGILPPEGDALIIENSNLHGKKDLHAVVQQKNQAESQAQQQWMQMQMQNQATVTEGIQSKAESDRALAAERLNKVGLDAALNMERMSRAEEERTAGALNLIKALKELDTMDLDNLQRKIDLIRTIEGKNDEKEPKSPVKKSA
jgi:hypothetical protein